MIAKCANPLCSNPFRYFGAGKLFPFELKNPSPPCKDVPNAVCVRRPHHHTIFFWLCRTCAGSLTLCFDPRTGVSVHALTPSGCDA
ncbi:MAG TPA: hypothetical protein VFU27_14790, partial [Terriglobales bacterium]|nr:hypothetical protein [Terriglobales bacterium]